MSKFTMKYDMNVHFVDNLLHKQIPLDIVGIIAEYTYPTKKQLFNEIKDNIKNKTPSIPRFINERVSDYLCGIENTCEKEDKVKILYEMLEYLTNFRFILFNKNMANNAGFIFCVKNKLQQLFDSYAINCQFYYRHIYQEDIHISDIMKEYMLNKVNKTNIHISRFLKHNVKRRLCSICELPGHGNRRCPQYK